MNWDYKKRNFGLFGGGDPNEENKVIFYAILIILAVGILFILTYYLNYQ